MVKLSKEEDILMLFFQEPSKYWHFSLIKKEISVADNKISRWLKIFIKKGLIKKISPKHKMPYYIANYSNPEYQTMKKLYSLKKLQESGFLNHLISLDSINTIIIFGSIIRWDWNTYSDIDVFIYGDASKFNKIYFEKVLGRDIQVFQCNNKSEFKKYSNSLIKNIIKGDLIKGDLDFLKVSVDA